MLELPTQLSRKPYRHFFDGFDRTKETFVDILRVGDSEFDFTYQDLLTQKTGYLSYHDMLESCRVMDTESKSLRLAQFNRQAAIARKEAFIDACIVKLVIDGVDQTASKDELKDTCHEESVLNWLAISEQYAPFYAALEQVAADQIKK